MKLKKILGLDCPKCKNRIVIIAPRIFQKKYFYCECGYCDFAGVIEQTKIKRKCYFSFKDLK